MKKQIELLTQIPIQQQNWQGLSDAKDSVIFPKEISCLFDYFIFRMKYSKLKLHLNRY
jgi:hypothetical protein